MMSARYKTPVEAAGWTFEDMLQAEKERREKLAARQESYQNAVKAGVPKSVLPDPNTIHSISDKDWKNVEQRIQRFTEIAPSSNASTAPMTRGGTSAVAPATKSVSI